MSAFRGKADIEAKARRIAANIAKLPGLFASLKDVDIGSVGWDILFNAYLSL